MDDTSDSSYDPMAGTMNQKARRDSVRSGRVKKKENASAGGLACTHCRSKKVKCILEEDGCKRCKRLGLRCPGPSEDSRRCPSSKSHIKELYERIAHLEDALAEANARHSMPSPSESFRRGSMTKSQNGHSPSSVPNGDNDNLISRLCGRQWKLNSDETGQIKFFGPTSSLHLTESVSSSLIAPRLHRSITEDASLDGLFDIETQTHLLDIYWTFQHTVLQVFDRDEFLKGMRLGQSQYFSKALLSAVYACAARISNRSEIRALVTPAQDDMDDDHQPYLVAMTEKLIDQEVRKPQITTVQALLLLSVIYCSSSKNTKGWLLTGNACRLAIDFGLHRAGGELASTQLSARDVKVRRITYLGCLVFDRFWALYLGRPTCLRTEDDDLVDMLDSPSDESWEIRLAVSWGRLLVALGRICDALNHEHCDTEMLEELDAQLEDWYQKVDADLRYYPRAHASVLLLHMQYYSSKIILHRATAEFGSTNPHANGQSDHSRRICIDNAKHIANALHDYRQAYGDATTLSGIGLHIISTASTILIADIAEKRSNDTTNQALALSTCILSLTEMEKTYQVARRVRRIIRLVMGLCHLEIDNIDMPLDSEKDQGSVQMSMPPVDPYAQAQLSQFVNPEADANMPWFNFFYANDLMSGASQFDIMYSLDC